MSIDYKKKSARLPEFVAVEEAEGLLAWLQDATGRKLDLSKCRHIHAANLQVLMAVRPAVSAWPEDADLCAWLRGALEIEQQ